MRKYLPGLIFTLCLLFPVLTQGQIIAVKTNVLYGAAALAPNLALEAAVAPRVTLEFSGSLNKWDLGSADNFKKLNHWLISAEGRFWVYEKFDGHFLGVHAFMGSYNAGGEDVPLAFFNRLKDSRYEGYAVGGGFSYGYQWYLGPHWNLEATVGVGYAYLNYDRYACARCGPKYGHGHRHYIGPTRLGVSFLYLFKSKRY